MRIRRLLALAVSVALVVSLTLTGCCTGTTDSSGEVLDALVSLFHTQYEDQITVTHSQWIGDVLASALKNNSSEAAVNDALSSIMSCSKNDFEDLASSVADKDHAHDLVVLSTSTNTPSAAARNAFDQWTSTLDAIVQKDGDYTADLAVMQTNGDYYILLHFKVGDVADPPVTDPDPEPDPKPEPDEGEEDSFFHVYNEGDLREWARLAKEASYQDKAVNCKLEANITLQGAWEPVCGISVWPYRGIFDGQGFTIRNLQVEVDGKPDSKLAGFIGSLSGTVKNLNLENVRVIAHGSDGYAGAVTGHSYGGTIQNCTVTNGYIQGGYAAGGIIGFATCHVENGCAIRGDTEICAISSDYAHAGGIAGINVSGVLSPNYTVDDTVKISATVGDVTVTPETPNQGSSITAGVQVG